MPLHRLVEQPVHLLGTSTMSNSSTSPEKQSLIPQLNPPLPTASPSEVRAFITELLILTRNLPAQHAKDIADKWHLGTGRELTTYPPSVYADIFGSEDAWMSQAGKK
ncbi:hypothetical protein D6C86_08955 [Aureobasidium pullulans]|nr:hypothetical protein D6C86_08955 [Aureobasidium pullulans]